MEKYVVFVKTNSDGYITAVNSNSVLSDMTDWIAIDSGVGDKYHHAQNNYFPDIIITDGGAYRYKLVNRKPVECSAEEIAAQEAAIKPVEPESIGSVWDELDAAYQRGVDSV